MAGDSFCPTASWLCTVLLDEVLVAGMLSGGKARPYDISKLQETPTWYMVPARKVRHHRVTISFIRQPVKEPSLPSGPQVRSTRFLQATFWRESFELLLTAYAAMNGCTHTVSSSFT